MDYLLDTHVLLWAMHEYDKVPLSVRKILLDEKCRKTVSIASLWEIAIKNRIGKLPLSLGIEGIYQSIDLFGFGFMAIDSTHIKAYNTLPLLHRDPFDGMLVATAMIEGFTLITADENIQKYDVPWVW
ncbi:MAG: type II toxin-antitoxin system VapC family toxin [Defluviitaleaceae bacterium]|nr:type II toxin-antitoxin system VapC family toxin [Defluviitaleaceae bacterium]